MAGREIRFAQLSKLRTLVLLGLLVVLCVWALEQYGYLRPFGMVMSFEETRIYDGYTDDGVPFAAVAYKSSDGQTLTVSGEERDTAQEAQERFEHLAKLAVTIIERNPKLDVNQKPVGERLVAIFSDGGSTILWRDGNELRVIRSRSLKHALEFERQFFATDRTDHR